MRTKLHHSARTAPSIALVLFLGAATLRAAAAPSPEDVRFFEDAIRPILENRCYECHSHGSKIKGGLTLDSRQGLLKGGDSGPAIVPGKPDESRLLKAVRRADEKLQMPPKAEKRLTPEQIAALEKWIGMGAPDPRTSDAARIAPQDVIRQASSRHWAFQPIVKPAVPQPKNSERVRTPVDAFVLAKLEDLGMQPAQPADRRTLIRRVYFDLIGLPPTMAEVDAFVNDTSAKAFETVVDRLLESPRYGERWGRHWLDVARYADTRGYLPGGVERRYPYSWTYRDYVIQAFNADLPFNDFIIQQLAADHLELGENKRPLAALGYLTLGRRFLNNNNDIIDDRIDVTMRGLMGLTVACARCHDHKYDPVPTADYYSLYGVFNSSVEPRELPLLGIKTDPAAQAKWKEERGERKKELDEFRSKKAAEAMAELRKKCGAYMLAVHEVGGWKDRRKQMSEIQKRKLQAIGVLRWKDVLDAVAKKHHPVFAHWVALAKLPAADFESKAKVALDNLANGPDSSRLVNGAVVRAFQNHPPKSMQDVAQVYTDLFNGAEKKWREALKAAKDEPLEKLGDPEWEALRELLYSAAGPPNIPEKFYGQLLAGDAPGLRSRQAKIDKVDATHPGAPPRAMAMVDRPRPIEPRIFIRGSGGNRGKQVPRQFLEFIEGASRKPFKQGSGRLELAKAITAPDNPLTARVIVNRVWMHHFGNGLVATPSDFGLRAEPPSHPELLDFLAAWFIENGGSFKKLHRLILLSSTWRQSSDAERGISLGYVEKDPEVRMLWRMNRRRLDFEAMRDSLIQATGKLDVEMGGISVDLVKQPYSLRRTVYGFVERQNLASLFRTFDFANPDSSNARRFSTTVPQQALFLMNSPFAIEQARHLAGREDVSGIAGDEARVARMYELGVQRRPTDEESAAAVKFIEAQRATALKRVPRNAWSYGYGRFDEASNSVKDFTPLPHFNGTRWQGSDAWPDPKLGYLTLYDKGGHPGENPKFHVVRRWRAPRDATVNIYGKFKQPAKQGDGVRARIVSSVSGKLGEWQIKGEEVGAMVAAVEVKRGDTIDFVVDCVGNTSHDTFVWAPLVRAKEGGSEWLASRDFRLSEPQAQPLNPWEQLAQALLLSNEFAFVD
jgi:hypothetical protein